MAKNDRGPKALSDLLRIPSTPQVKKARAALEKLRKRKRLCPRHGEQPGDPIAAGVNCNGKSMACPVSMREEGE